MSHTHTTNLDLYKPALDDTLGDSLTGFNTNSDILDYTTRYNQVQSISQVWSFIAAVITGDLTVTDGDVLLTGTARVEKEFIIPLDGFGKGAAKPTEAVLGNYVGFAFSLNDLGYFEFEIPSDWDSTEDIEIVAHWYCNETYAANSGEVRWAVIWTATKEDGTEAVDATTTTTPSEDVNIPATAKALTETKIAIPAASLAQHDVIGFQFKRVALDDGTDPTAEPVIISMECEYIANKLGLSIV